MADCIIAGTGGGGVSSDELNARAAQVLAGRSYVGADTEDEAGTGTMPNIGSVQRTLHAGESMAIPQGYHDGTGAVAAVSLAEQTPGTAAGGDIISGRAAWVDGRRVDGTLIEREGEQPTTGVTISDGLAHVGMLPGAYRKNGRYGTPEVKAPVDMVARAAGVDGSKMLQGYNVLAVPGKIPIVDSSGDNGRSTMSPWFGLDGNNRTMWIELPFRSAYYTRPDNKPHVTIDIEALGNAEAHHVLQGVTATSKWGIKFNGSIPTWNLSGNLGGTQGVVTAFQNSAFAGDYQSLGRGVFTRILGHVYMPPSTMWVWAPAPTLLPQNIRAGVNILGVSGSMVDYAQNCVPFDGARFDGVHLSGWASGMFKEAKYAASMNWQGLSQGAQEVTSLSSRTATDIKFYWAFTPSVHFGAFRTLRVSAYIDVYNCNFGSSGYGSMRVSLWRPGGRQGSRLVDNIKSLGDRHDGGTYQFDIPVGEVTEPAFIAVQAYIDNARRREGKDGAYVRAGVTRVELIA